MQRQFGTSCSEFEILECGNKSFAVTEVSGFKPLEQNASVDFKQPEKSIQGIRITPRCLQPWRWQVPRAQLLLLK